MHFRQLSYNSFIWFYINKLLNLKVRHNLTPPHIRPVFTIAIKILKTANFFFRNKNVSTENMIVWCNCTYSYSHKYLLKTCEMLPSHFAGFTGNYFFFAVGCIPRLNKVCSNASKNSLLSTFFRHCLLF